jgi:hypothetical protein
MSLEPAALAALRAGAERGMTEDAAPAPAAAREALLQHYRDAARTGEQLSIDDIEWIERLARAGHVPAAELLARIFAGVRIDVLLADQPQRLLALAPQSPTLARRLAWRELRQPAPDLARLREWLGWGGELCRGVAAALHELAAITGSTPAQDVALVSSMVFRRGPVEDLVRYATPEAWEFLLAFSRRRSDSADEEERRASRRLLERSAALGSGEAADELFAADFDAAPDKAAFVQAWLDAGKPMTPTACVRAGAERERAGALGQAIAWYERAVHRKPWKSADRLDGEFCYAVAHAFDARWSRVLVDDPELAVRWHARAAEAGDERSLDTWLDTCVKGQLGLAADPDAALALVQRYRASALDLRIRRWRLEPCLRALRRGADAEKDPARAARWREVIALVESDSGTEP